MIHGLCYKFNLSNPLPMQNKSLQLAFATSNLGLDRLKKVDLFIGEEDTWQGIIGYDSSPPMTVNGVLSVNIFNQVSVAIQENKHKNSKGTINFDRCMIIERNINCNSIFDPTLHP